MSDELHGSADKMSALSQRVNEALASGNIDQLKQIIGSDPEALAKAVSAPVGVERIAVFPVEDFGSAMAPLYTTLGAVGGIAADHGVAQPGSLRTRQARGRAGRAQVLAVVLRALWRDRSCSRSCNRRWYAWATCCSWVSRLPTHCCILLCFWTAGFVFSFIVYTLVSLFANLGKALAVLLLIIYVTGGGGSFPLQLLPGFFQAAQPVFAGDACHQRHACGEHGPIPERFLGADRYYAFLHRAVRNHGHPAAGALALHVLVRGAGGEVEGGRLAGGSRIGWSFRARSGFGPRPFRICACVRPRSAVRLALTGGFRSRVSGPPARCMEYNHEQVQHGALPA